MHPTTEQENNRQPQRPAPTSDQLMSLLATVTDTYSWTAFKPILYDPERLKAWLVEKIQPEPERYLNPEDPAAVELSEMSAETEFQAMEFLNELTPEEQEKITEALRGLWGREGTATMPVRME